MSERVETWKARETIRLHLGLAVAYLVFVGGLTVALEALSWVGVGKPEWNVPRPAWAAAGLFALQFLASVAELVRERSLSLALPLALLATIYLVLPSTGKRFARAQG